MGQSAISCRNVTFRYFETSKPILEQVSLELPAGKISVLMGSSGCGKLPWTYKGTDSNGNFRGAGGRRQEPCDRLALAYSD